MSPKPLLLIQTCHPPQMVFLARRLRRRQPGRRIEAVLLDADSNRRRFHDLSAFDRVWYSRGEWPSEAAPPRDFEAVVFPLLGSGYRRLKKLRKRAGPQARSCRWEGVLGPVGRLAMWKAALRPPAPPAEFLEFLKAWPQWPLQGRVLEVIASPSLRRASRRAWKPFLSQAHEVEQSRGGLLREWRRLRGRSFQGALVYFGGERGGRSLRFLPWLLGVPRVIVVDEGGLHDLERRRHSLRFALKRLLTRPAHRALVGSVLFIQTEVPEYLVASVKRLRAHPAYRHAKVTVLCRQADRELVEKALPECDLLLHSGRRLFDFWRLWKRARWVPADELCAVFTGRPVFRPYKLLFFLLNVRRRLVFNASLERYVLTLRSWPRIFRKDRLRADVVGDAGLPKPDHILLVQTDGMPRMGQVLERLRHSKVISGSPPITVVCNRQREGAFRKLPQVDDVLTYTRGDWRGYLKLWWHLRRRQTDVAAALFSGRPTFRLSKLFFFLIRARNRLIFNSQLECYYLGWRTWGMLLRRERTAADAMPHRLLLIQSEDDAEMVKAMQTVRSPSLARVARLFVLCRQDRKPFFQSQPGVARVITYRKEGLVKNLRLWGEMRRLRLDSVAAMFSGRPIFRLQKLLFFLAPARHRLVINENHDCFYFRFRRLGRFLTMHARQSRGRFLLTRWAFRTALKAVLFLPRFFYLVMWLTYMRLRRAYSLRLEEAPKRR
ncbi:MAG TPA: hypothetical protein VLU25_12770 [Acidobacteriota bacterium]|nr:hypothetical protein [Acidobacteriota bacterium]